MYTIYEEHIEQLEEENADLKQEVVFLRKIVPKQICLGTILPKLYIDEILPADLGTKLYLKGKKKHCLVFIIRFLNL